MEERIWRWLMGSGMWGLPQPTRQVGAPVQVGKHGMCNAARRQEATFLPDPLSCCPAPSRSLSSPLEIPPAAHALAWTDGLLDVSLPSPHPHSHSRHARPVEEAPKPVDKATALSELSWWFLSSPTETLFHLQNLSYHQWHLSNCKGKGQERIKGWQKN